MNGKRIDLPGAFTISMENENFFGKEKKHFRNVSAHWQRAEIILPGKKCAPAIEAETCDHGDFSFFAQMKI